jgi:hypothetical protein
MLETMIALRWLARAVVGGLLSGCFSADSAEADDYMDEDLPAGNCMTGTGCATEGGADASGGVPAGSCESTLQCDDEQICVATFDGDIGEFECRSMCIIDMDEDHWCLDDDACCMAGSICSERGYCMPGDGTTAADETAADETTGADETGADTTTMDTTTTDTGDASTSDTTGAATSSTGTGG